MRIVSARSHLIDNTSISRMCYTVHMESPG